MTVEPLTAESAHLSAHFDLYFIPQMTQKLIVISMTNFPMSIISNAPMKRKERPRNDGPGPILAD